MTMRVVMHASGHTLWGDQAGLCPFSWQIVTALHQSQSGTGVAGLRPSPDDV